MKTQLKPAALALLSPFILHPSSLLGQGSLTPPGAPAPTMKSLAQIEPRVDVATLTGHDLTHVILGSAGSYYLSTNLAVTKDIGISIEAAGVTLDLNGFEIARIEGIGGDGIRINGGCDRVTVRNGTIRGFSYGINGSPSPVAKGCLFEKLAVTGCSTAGLFVGESARVIDCRAHDNAGHGIVALAGAVISGCTAQLNYGNFAITGGRGSTISGCTARDNQGTYGIYGFDGSTISGCTASGNVGNGPSSYGIYGGDGCTIIGCVSYSNFNTNSPAIASHGIGIYADGGGTVKDCTVTFNRGDGIRVSVQSRVEGNTCVSNGFQGDGAGIRVLGVRNRIEANTVMGNPRGIEVNGPSNLIVRNNAGINGTGTNYVIAARNRYGPILELTFGSTAEVNGSTAPSTIGTTDPWANFSH